MKKGGLIVYFLLLIPAAALAHEKTLCDIGQDMFDLVEAYNACASGGIVCTEDDALALQSNAKNSLRDLAMLIKSVNFQRMIINPGQARALNDRANSVRGRLAHIEVFDGLCNRAIILMRISLGAIEDSLNALLYFMQPERLPGASIPILLALIIFFTTVLFISVVLVFVAFFLMGSCLFWWL